MLLPDDRHLVLTGIGIWGNNMPVGWAFDIINFVWWIGIGHAGTLISAILLVVEAEMANLDQPVCRGDDIVRGCLCGPVSGHFTLGGRGSVTGCFLIRTRWESGRNFEAR